MARSDLIDIELIKHHETASAILVSEGGDRNTAVWLPLSQIEVEEKKGSITVTMPKWLATDKGFV